MSHCGAKTTWQGLSAPSSQVPERKGRAVRMPAMLFKRSPAAIQRLLVVEDEPLVAFDNEHFLISEGYEVVATVDNAADALAILEQQDVEAVLLDVNLAGERSGVDVARAAHQRGIAVLFVSGSIPDDAGNLAVAALSKPYGQRDLAAALKAVDAIVAGREPSSVPASVQLFG